MTLAQDRPAGRAQVAARPSAPPPRPRLASDLVPPWLAEPERARPTALRVAAAGWLAAVVAGLVGLTALAADSDALRGRLTAVATADDPSAPAALVRSGVRTTLLLVTGGQALLTVLVLLWVALLLRRRSWARWAMTATGAVTLAFAVLAASVVAGGPEVDRWAFLAEAGLVVVGTLALFRRGVRDALDS